jgi:hypothetical protein
MALIAAHSTCVVAGSTDTRAGGAAIGTSVSRTPAKGCVTDRIAAISDRFEPRNVTECHRAGITGRLDGAAPGGADDPGRPPVIVLCASRTSNLTRDDAMT